MSGHKPNHKPNSSNKTQPLPTLHRQWHDRNVNGRQRDN